MIVTTLGHFEIFSTWSHMLWHFEIIFIFGKFFLLMNVNTLSYFWYSISNSHPCWIMCVYLLSIWLNISFPYSNLVHILIFSINHSTLLGKTGCGLPCWLKVELRFVFSLQHVDTLPAYFGNYYSEFYPVSWLIVCVWGQFWVKPLLMFLTFNHGAYSV